MTALRTRTRHLIDTGDIFLVAHVVLIITGAIGLIISLTANA